MKSVVAVNQKSNRPTVKVTKSTEMETALM